MAWLIEALISPFQVKLAVTPVNKLPTNWPWPALNVPLESSKVPTEPELEDDELLDEELDDELLEEELELLDEEVELLDDELELELEVELLDELLEEVDEELELLEDELDEVPPHADKVTAMALAHNNRASGD